ncbi:MAG: nitroreductase, partial [Candidatus Caldarchaeum sp.]|nr:nitroreductase [Candidatus Caldarchaeum sp.]
MQSRRSFLRSGAFISLVVGSAVVGLTFLTGFIGRREQQPVDAEAMKTITLPRPRLDGPMSVEQAIQRRRSRREYTNQPLTVAEVSQLLWAAQGVTAP